MEIVDIRNELLAKKEDLSQARAVMEMDSPEWWVAHTTLNWIDELLNEIYRSSPELRPQAVTLTCEPEEGEGWKE